MLSPLPERTKLFTSDNKSLQAQVYRVLSDGQWHCRNHEYSSIPSGQLAGGGGIQGLQRGTKTRPGIDIEPKWDHCERCKKNSVGQVNRRNNFSFRFIRNSTKAPERILEYFHYIDAAEQRKRPSHELTIDHRFPRQRWGGPEDSLDISMDGKEISKNFQLLKREPAGNHNLLKSRPCERCFKTGVKGTPFGIQFFYSGSATWPPGVPQKGREAEKGCIGCGWYDLETWRQELNKQLLSIARK